MQTPSRPENNYNSGGQGSEFPSLEEMFPESERYRNFNFNNSARRLDTKYNSISDLLRASAQRNQNRAQELYDYSINNTVDGRINMNSPYLYSAGNMAPNPIQPTPTQPTTPALPQGGNPFRQAAMNAGLNDFNSLGQQSNQAAVLRGEGK